MISARVGIGVAHSEGRGTILAGGIALVGGALAFLGVFSYLAARFQYPDVLDGSPPEVLPALLATRATGRTMWALYGVLPRVFIPAGVGAFEALRHRASGTMRVGMLFAVLAALSMMLGLMRWPSVHWELARACAAAAEGDGVVLAAVFDGLNRVESAGKDVKRFKKGDAIVASTGMAGGGHARYVCLPEKGALALKSESLTWEEAVAIPFGANTALYFLRNLGKIEAGQELLITIIIDVRARIDVDAEERRLFIA